VIVLSKDPSSVALEVGDEAVCVRHKSYGPPPTRDGCLHVTWDEYEPNMLRGRTTMVVVGLSKIITPGNRTKVGPFLLRPVPGVRRIVVDRTLFVSEPWRAWFPFGCVGAPYREYTYSYLAESHWRAHIDGARTDNPFALDVIVEHGRGVIRSTYERFFDEPRIETIGVPQEVHEKYAKLKARAFEEETTIKAIIARLSAFAASVCKTRRIPSPSSLFASAGAPTIYKTDLKVDEFLTKRLLELVELTNGIARAFYAG
jgi:hypothetical protein